MKGIDLPVNSNGKGGTCGPLNYSSMAQQQEGCNWWWGDSSLLGSCAGLGASAKTLPPAEKPPALDVDDFIARQDAEIEAFHKRNS
jgi:hypothetical protein